jgi:nitrogen fixation protein NifB
MDADRPVQSDALEPCLHVLRLVLPAAPFPLVLRRDRLPGDPAAALDVADVLRYVGAARRVRRGPLVAQIEGPGDPLASPASVLRALALLREHDPDVMTGLVIDGPLLGEYADELVDLAVHHVVVRMDAATLKVARRVYGRACYRGEVLAGYDAARLVLEEGRRAVRRLVAMRIPTAIRFTAIPTVNLGDLPAVAAFAAGAGAERVDVVPHRPVRGAPLSRAGTPTAGEMARARDAVRRAYEAATPDGIARAPGALSWFEAARMEDVPLASLEHVEAVALVEDPEVERPEAPILPRRRAQMVAVATTDGAFIDRALCDATSVRVYAVGSDSTALVGTRALPAEGLRRRDGVGSPRDLLRAVAGCHAVVATRFTPRAATLLGAVGIRAYVAGGHVPDVLDRIARGVLRPPASD